MTIDDLDEFELPDMPADIELCSTCPECPECGDEVEFENELCSACASDDEVTEDVYETENELPF